MPMPQRVITIMDVSQLEVLLAVAQERGFSRAASKLYRTQPAISQSIRRLEDELGEVLFDRSSKDGTLTAAGELLVEYARQMLNIRHEALGAVKELKDLNRGKVTIAANEYTVMYLLPLVTQFHQNHPQIKVEVKRSLASRISSEVIGRTVELGVVSFHPGEAMLRAVPVIKDEIALIVTPGHPLADRKTVSVRELGGESFIGHIVSS
ncbi:MAG: LysR family transcriptional regulator, partial [Pyrinomonadaceae bacterium]